MPPLTITILGSGTSHGVPMIACDCHVCTSADPRDKRTRPGILIQFGNCKRNRSDCYGRLDGTTMASSQQWADLDLNGNWNDFRQTVGGGSSEDPPQIQTRTAGGNNEVAKMDPDGEPVNNPCEYGCIPFTSLDYDLAGNLKHNPFAPSAGDGSGPLCCGTGQEYDYDEENRVVAIYKDTNQHTGPFNETTGANEEPKIYEFKYDALGRRIVTIQYLDETTGDPLSTPRSTVHVFSGLEVILEYVCEGESNPEDCDTWSLAREFVWGDENRFPEPIARLDHTSLGAVTSSETEVFYYLADALGSTIGLADNSGALVERYMYDPYGRTVAETKTGSTWTFGLTSAYANPYLWTGQRYDPASQTYHFWARTFSPNLGRWLQRDPLGYVDGVNLYEYVRGNPILKTDPMGESAIAVALPIAGGAAVADGPLPIGDIIGGVILIGALVWDAVDARPVPIPIPIPRVKARIRRCEDAYKKYDKACGEDRRCTPGMSCDAILSRIKSGMACLAGRNSYIGMGCDDLIPTKRNHHLERNNAAKALTNCEEIAQKQKCPFTACR